MLRRLGRAATALVVVLTIAGAGPVLADDTTALGELPGVPLIADISNPFTQRNGALAAGVPTSTDFARTLTPTEQDLAWFFTDANLVLLRAESLGSDCAGSPPLYCAVAPVAQASLTVFLLGELGIEQDEGIALLAAGCLTDGESTPQRTTSVSDQDGPELGTGGRTYKYRIEIEDGLPVEADCFSTYVGLVLGDTRSWVGGGEVSLQQTSGSDYDFRLVLASPGLTDRLCSPLRTGGIYSCRSGNRVVINFMRWESGAEAFGADMATYRAYLLNHEVGHQLGHGHRLCSVAGRPAPVMAQQTKGVGACEINGWPLENER